MNLYGGRSWLVAACIGMVLAAAAPARGAVTIGPDLTSPPNAGVGCSPCTALNTALPSAQLTSPINGVVVRYSLRKGAAATNLGDVSLRILRPTGAGTFDGVGTSTPMPTMGSPTLTTFPTSLPIQAGDYIGMTATFQLQERSLSGATVGTYIGSLFPDSDPPAAPNNFNNDFELLLNADVEPDADCDGLGDETQDPQLAGGCLPLPETTLTKRPKNLVKTSKRRVKVKFRFSSSATGTSFQCKLDGKPFRPCDSPKTFKVKATFAGKKHKFQVEAIDAAGRPDSSPAIDRFKAKRVD